MPDALPFALPLWVDAVLAGFPAAIAGDEERMRLSIELARRNVAEGTGGPFGAVVFERGSGRIVAAGVNRVVPTNQSIAHAELSALSRAQASVGSFSLAAEGLPAMELVTSAQMCALCLGAVVWSGVTRVVFGATTDDVQQIVGFDEGPIHPEWRTQLEGRGIEVTGPVCRDAAKGALREYVHSGGSVYNAHPPAQGS